MISFLTRRRRGLVCRDAVALMTDYLEDRLSPRDARRLEQHLAACPHCSEYLAQLRATIDALGQADIEELSPAAVHEFVNLYRAWRTE